jgi:cell division protein FtsB
MKPFVVVLLALFVLLQYRLWFASDGIVKVIRMKHQIAVQQETNDFLLKKNAALLSEINSLKKGGGAIESRARKDLGMVKKGETFYQILK